jgi:splicing factor 1
MARDCTVNKDPNAVAAFGGGGQSPPPMNKGGFDSEYASLMEELGEGGRGHGGDIGKSAWSGPSAGHDITAGGSNIPPWRRPEVWQTTATNTQQPPVGGGYRPPQAGYGGYGGAPGAYGAGQQQWGMQAGYPQGGTGYAQQQGQDYSANYAQYYQNQYAQQQIAAPSH